MAPGQRANTLNQVLDNYSRILLLCTQAIAQVQATGQATPATVDAVVTLVQNMGSPGALTALETYVLTPRMDTSVDGESHGWMAFQSAIVNLQLPLMVAAQRAGGPYQIRSRATGS